MFFNEEVVEECVSVSDVKSEKTCKSSEDPDSGDEIPEPNSNNPVHAVRCGALNAKLHLQKFTCPGIHKRCIEFEGQMISPRQFTIKAEKDKQKDWKGSIRLGRYNLRTLMEEKTLDFYNHANSCSLKCQSRNYIKNRKAEALDNSTLDSNQRSHVSTNYIDDTNDSSILPKKTSSALEDYVTQTVQAVNNSAYFSKMELQPEEFQVKIEDYVSVNNNNITKTSANTPVTNTTHFNALDIKNNNLEDIYRLDLHNNTNLNKKMPISSLNNNIVSTIIHNAYANASSTPNIDLLKNQNSTSTKSTLNNNIPNVVSANTSTQQIQPEHQQNSVRSSSFSSEIDNAALVVLLQALIDQQNNSKINEQNKTLLHNNNNISHLTNNNIIGNNNYNNISHTNNLINNLALYNSLKNGNNSLNVPTTSNPSFGLISNSNNLNRIKGTNFTTIGNGINTPNLNLQELIISNLFQNKFQSNLTNPILQQNGTNIENNCFLQIGKIMESTPAIFWSKMRELGILEDLFATLSATLEDLKKLYLTNNSSTEEYAAQKLSIIAKTLDLEETYSSKIHARHVQATLESTLINKELHELQQKAEEQKQRLENAKRKSQVFDQILKGNGINGNVIGENEKNDQPPQYKRLHLS